MVAAISSGYAFGFARLWAVVATTPEYWMENTGKEKKITTNTGATDSQTITALRVDSNVSIAIWDED